MQHSLDIPIPPCSCLLSTCKAFKTMFKYPTTNLSCRLPISTEGKCYCIDSSFNFKSTKQTLCGCSEIYLTSVAWVNDNSLIAVWFTREQNYSSYSLCSLIGNRDNWNCDDVCTSYQSSRTNLLILMFHFVMYYVELCIWCKRWMA